MAVASTSFESLAYYQFSTSTGTTSYTYIRSGNHYTMVNEGGTVYLLTWSGGSETYNFQSNRSYTFEYDGSDYYMITEGTFSAPQQTTKIAVTLKRMENLTEIPKPLE